jgi:hypothetical protein
VVASSPILIVIGFFLGSCLSPGRGKEVEKDVEKGVEEGYRVGYTGERGSVYPRWFFWLEAFICGLVVAISSLCLLLDVLQAETGGSR